MRKTTYRDQLRHFKNSFLPEIESVRVFTFTFLEMIAMDPLNQLRYFKIDLSLPEN